MDLGEFAGNSLAHCFVSTNSWILNIGATSHICRDKSFFKSLVPLQSPSPLFLPDGSSKIIHIARNVIISPTLTLHNVLFCLNLKHNMHYKIQ